MKIGSLFSGIGGIDIGFLQAGFTVAWANDCDPQACKTYRFNFPNVKLYEMDICRYNPTEPDHVDVITAGFPCQPFSICGSQNGFSDKRGGAFFRNNAYCGYVEPSYTFPRKCRKHYRP